MKFILFNVDEKRLTRHKAPELASIVSTVTDKRWWFVDPDAQIELVTPRLFGWLSGILPDKREWVTPIPSDDAFPYRFEFPSYRKPRPWKEISQAEQSAHQVTYDVAMTEVQRKAGSSFWNWPLSITVVTVALAFFAMVAAWIITGATS